VNDSTHPAEFERLLADYDYALPESAIAQRPADPRDGARLLVLDRRRATLEETRVGELAGWLQPGDLLVVNDTRVIPARLFGRKRPGGGRVELLLLRCLGGSRWEAWLHASGRMRAGLVIDLDAGFEARVIGPREDPAWEIEIAGPGDDAAWLTRAGHMPLPPYIHRPDDERDREAYQTIFAAHAGAVAAPTAGLHFTPALVQALGARGIDLATVTLHVGAGTFQPLRAEDVERGALHAEVFDLPVETAARVTRARARNGRVIAVGTTSARVLETQALADRRVRAGQGETRLFIRPPYAPRVVDALLTNFHLPRSSLLMLVAAFAGRERVLAAYAEALRRGFRFYSFGDAMLIL
jgi:S-adenosylmethionine:tRNA ribosyltransferase-isomerase